MRSIVEINGFVSTVAMCAEDPLALVSTVDGGAHLFNLANMTSKAVVRPDANPLDASASCFLSAATRGAFSVGTANGELLLFADADSQPTCLALPTGSPIISLEPIRESRDLLAVDDSGVHIIDIAAQKPHTSLSIAQRGLYIGAFDGGSNVLGVVLSDGHVLLMDTRASCGSGSSCKAVSVRRVPNEVLSSLAYCARTAEIVVGAVSGHVYALRGVNGNPASTTKQQAFSIGRQRSAIRAIAVDERQVFTGHVDGRLAVVQHRGLGAVVDANRGSAHRTAKLDEAQSSKRERRVFEWKNLIPMSSLEDESVPQTAVDWTVTSLQVSDFGLCASLASQTLLQSTVVFAFPGENGGKFLD